MPAQAGLDRGAVATPTARALIALRLIRRHPGITANRLAEALGVSERAARRYVGVLREAGVEVESARGPHGGYRLGRELRLSPLTFTPAEALGLVMAVLDGHHDARDPSHPVGSALETILRALPQPVAAQAEAVRRTTAPAPDRAAARPDGATTTALVQACLDRRRLLLRYETGSASERVFDVDPWAVVVRHGRWYLLCWSRTAEARRAYRVDRVRGVEERGVATAPPDGLDPVAVLEEHLGLGWEHEAEVVVEAPVDQVRPCVPRGLGRLEPVDRRTSRLVGSTSNPTWYAEQLARIPAPFRVVEGPAVHDAVQALAARLSAAVAADPGRSCS